MRVCSFSSTSCRFACRKTSFALFSNQEVILSWAGVSGNSRSRPFPRKKPSDSHSRIIGMEFFIPFPFQILGMLFFHSISWLSYPKTIGKPLKAIVSGLKNIKWKWLAQKINLSQWFPWDHYNLPRTSYVCMLWAIPGGPHQCAQTWYLSNLLHSRIFRPRILHRQIAYCATLFTHNLAAYISEIWAFFG